MAQSVKGGVHAAVRRRHAKRGSDLPRSGLRPQVSLEEVARTCSEALEADFSAAGLPNEIDWSARLLSLVVIQTLFPRHLRTTPEVAATLLERVLPERQREIATSENVSDAYERAREEWLSEQGMTPTIRSLYTGDRIPLSLVAPWESYADVNRAMQRRLRGLGRKELVYVET
ncbi:MAG: hypothetical protein M3N29_00825 [Chloroflexota bacterium]|nr:hypothetical protein [Chloroflexota bacterium]